MFQTFLPHYAALLSFAVTILFVSAGAFVRQKYNRYCTEHENCANTKITVRGNALKLTVLVSFSIAGLFIGNLINIGTTFYTALTHGMTANPDTGKYDISYGEMQMLNKNSVKETNADIYDLKNKAIIYIRYDCPDCIILHNQLADINGIIFLSSRTEKGKKVREMYNINLTEIPQGVYIDADGKSTTVRITQGSGDSLILDLQQIATLKEMTAQERPTVK